MDLNSLRGRNIHIKTFTLSEQHRMTQTYIYIYIYSVDLLPYKGYNIYTYTPYAAASPINITQ